MNISVSYSYPLIRDILLSHPNITLEEISLRSGFPKQHVDRVVNDTHAEKFGRDTTYKPYKYWAY